MIITTKGFVLHCVSYSESSIIAHIYTKEYGIGSYIMNSVRGKRSKMAYFQPFSHIQFSAYKKQSNGISRIKEIEFAELYLDINSNIYKANITHFLGDFLHKIIHSQEAHEQLYTYIHTNIAELNSTQEYVGDFHIKFLLRLMPFFGIQPQAIANQNNVFFDMQAGCFVQIQNEHCVNREKSFYMQVALQAIEKNMSISLQKKERFALLELILEYYRIHVHACKPFQSLQILQSIFA
jgi:DNA repair protein RecO (recombination protein O)